MPVFSLLEPQTIVMTDLKENKGYSICCCYCGGKLLSPVHLVMLTLYKYICTSYSCIALTSRDTILLGGRASWDITIRFTVTYNFEKIMGFGCVFFHSIVIPLVCVHCLLTAVVVHKDLQQHSVSWISWELFFFLLQELYPYSHSMHCWLVLRFHILFCFHLFIYLFINMLPMVMVGFFRSLLDIPTLLLGWANLILSGSHVNDWLSPCCLPALLLNKVTEVSIDMMVRTAGG